MSDTVEPLGPQHEQALRALLARDPVDNLYLLGLFEKLGIAPRPGQAEFAFWGSSSRGELTAALFVGGTGGLLVPSTHSEASLGAIGQHLFGKVKPRSSLGDKLAVDALVRQLGAGRPKVSRLQRLFKVSADDLGPFTNPALRLATEQDLPALRDLAVTALEEGLRPDPWNQNRDRLMERIRQRLLAQRTYVLADGGRLVFKVDVGSRSAYGAELEWLYTAPAERRRGHATLSLGQISRHLLSSLPRLTLRVDERDAPMAALARRVGYVPGRVQRWVVF